ncbi:LA_2272 family surface repeat-containing protein [Chryseobacterium daecheongense]|uniref:Uncharacterized protein n=1 Tax=Chryseobacterium daecheongense TaxID=192389 RepID=A0A3N0W6B6_9FLAO|nr:hypothetical protein [Chryseobacterium daecheongense]ROI00588.1 hypothetical protein EGI05_06825 [Chryseobacterium daecheongense]TDX94430.1 hypothetical protein BCF50_0195 [Chryseobacterium daecheongense]
MKTKFLFIIGLLSSYLVFGQDSLRMFRLKTQFIAFTPLKNEIEKVNGLTVGLGFDSRYAPNTQSNFQKVNGLNLDINPLGFLIWMFYDPSRIAFKEAYLQVNGINISAAGYVRGVNHNGVSLSMYNYGNTMNGMLVSAITTDIEKGNGVLISGLGISAKELKGLSISIFNDANTLKGMQIGFHNKATTGKGLQIGIVNKSDKLRGLQIGFWNKNGKRKLPLVNWNFKAKK